MSPATERQGLGHGYRLEVAIVTWRGEDVLVVPASALFRLDGKWSVFREINGIAQLTHVEIGKSNGTFTEVLGGLEPSENVVLYPSAAVENGSRIEQRQ